MSEIFSLSFRYISTRADDRPHISHVLQTCRVIRQFRFQRSLWLEALIRLKEEYQPLPLSTADPLETLSLPELQSVARRADRLKKNWQSNNPRLVHMHSFAVPSQARIMLIPGAHLAVAYASGIISCWDILSSQWVAHLEIPELEVRAEALCMDINGKVLIGACIKYVSRGGYFILSLSGAVQPAPQELGGSLH
jgi:hypothetical protein